MPDGSVEYKVAFTITSKDADKAAAQQKKLSDELRQTADQVRKVTQFLRDFGRLAEVAIRGAVRLFADLTKAALEFRAAGDPVRKQLEAFGKSFEVLKARLGDALLPILQGVAKVLGPIVEKATEWVTQNRQLVTSKVLEFLAGFAEIAGTVMIEAIQKGVGAVKAFVGAFYGLSGVVGKTWGHFLMLIGQEDQAWAAWNDGADAMGKMQKIWESIASDEGFADKVKNKLKDIVAQIKEAAANSGKLLQPGGTTKPGGGTAPKETLPGFDMAAAIRAEADEKKRLWALERQWYAIRADAIDELREKERRLREEQRKAAEEIVNKFAPAILGAAEATGQTFAAAIEGGKLTAKMMGALAKDILLNFLRMISTEVQALAVKAAAEVIAGNAGLGPLGLAIGLGLAGVAMSTVTALLSSLPKAQRGMVVGGVAGRDSVMAMVEPGEAVLPVPQAERDRSSGVAAVEGRGRRESKVEIHNHYSVPVSEAQATRDYRRGVLPELRRLGIVPAR